jgi:hypothetical protein
MGKLSRDKGARWEREVAKALRAIDPGAKRTGFHQAQGGSTGACDVSAGLFWAECKVGLRPPILGALKQAEDGCPPGRFAIAVCKQDRERPTVTMSMETFVELASAASLWWAR